MPSFERESQKIVIAGASSLLGAEVKSLLEESKFAGWDLHLVDEEVTVGTLTQVWGEPVVVQRVEEGTFDKAQIIFFAGSAQFARSNVLATWPPGIVIDVSGGMADLPTSSYWLPGVGKIAAQAEVEGNAAYVIPTAAATAVSLLALALASLGLKRLVVSCALPVSDAGRPGIEELESQTARLLSMRDIDKPIYDTQVAFNLLDRFGARSLQSLEAVKKRIRSEVKLLVGTRAPRPAVSVVHAPVFYGTAFSAWAELDRGAQSQAIVEACRQRGFVFEVESEGPSNVSVAGENAIHLAMPEPEPAQVGTWWFWGAADNIRLPAWNAVKLAEKLL